MTKVFIVGEAGTTGLRLRTRLSSRPDLELLKINDSLRKDPEELRRPIEKADFVFLCLPDEAAIEICKLAKGTKARLIDCSTAHRTALDWTYGFPELSSSHKESLGSAKYVSSPGCHASGFIALIYPLISQGILPKDALLACTSLTGYSGGGKNMISEYEATDRNSIFSSPRLYSLEQNHKHLPEIVVQCGLNSAPTFLPIVGDFYAGMLTTITIHHSQLNKPYDVKALRDCYHKHYDQSPLIHVMDEAPSALYAGTFAGRDDMALYVSGNAERLTLCSLFDNLGKGASGAAIQCLNMMCHLPEETGLVFNQKTN